VFCSGVGKLIAKDSRMAWNPTNVGCGANCCKYRCQVMEIEIDFEDIDNQDNGFFDMSEVNYRFRKDYGC
jgi:hypothetical protein